MTNTNPQLIAAHYIALLLLSTAALDSPEHHEIIEQNGPGVWTALAELGLVESATPDSSLWRLSERGQVLVEHVLALPLPEPVRAWRMPGAPSPSALAPREPYIRLEEVRGSAVDLGAGVKLHPGGADSEDGDAPPPPPKPKPIPGVVPLEDMHHRMDQAGMLLESGYGLNEVAETLEMDPDAIDRHFFPSKSL